MYKILKFFIPLKDKLIHFFLFSIGLTGCLSALSDIQAYIVCVSVAILWELY